jgi:hypothetical protein
MLHEGRIYAFVTESTEGVRLAIWFTECAGSMAGAYLVCQPLGGLGHLNQAKECLESCGPRDVHVLDVLLPMNSRVIIKWVLLSDELAQLILSLKLRTIKVGHEHVVDEEYEHFVCKNGWSGKMVTLERGLVQIGGHKVFLPRLIRT